MITKLVLRPGAEDERERLLVGRGRRRSARARGRVLDAARGRSRARRRRRSSSTRPRSSGRTVAVIRPCRRLAGGRALLGRLDAVVDRVAHHVDQRVLDRLQHAPVDAQRRRRWPSNSTCLPWLRARSRTISGSRSSTVDAGIIRTRRACSSSAVDGAGDRAPVAPQPVDQRPRAGPSSARSRGRGILGASGRAAAARGSASALGHPLVGGELDRQQVLAAPQERVELVRGQPDRLGGARRRRGAAAGDEALAAAPWTRGVGATSRRARRRRAAAVARCRRQARGGGVAACRSGPTRRASRRSSDSPGDLPPSPRTSVADRRDGVLEQRDDRRRRAPCPRASARSGAPRSSRTRARRRAGRPSGPRP